MRIDLWIIATTRSFSRGLYATEITIFFEEEGFFGGGSEEAMDECHWGTPFLFISNIYPNSSLDMDNVYKFENKDCDFIKTFKTWRQNYKFETKSVILYSFYIYSVAIDNFIFFYAFISSFNTIWIFLFWYLLYHNT